MSAFPALKTGAVLQYPASHASNFATEVIRFLDGKEQRFPTLGVPLRLWLVRLDLLDESELVSLEQFFRAQQGRFGSFSFTDPWTNAVVPNCSLSDDQIALEFAGEMRGSTTLIVRENPS